MRLLAAALAAFLLWVSPASAQSCPPWGSVAVLTVGQWKACFDAKQNALGFTPVNKAGDSMLGLLSMLASSASTAGLNLGVGTAPSSPVDGDLWITSSGFFARVNGVTIGPINAVTSEITVGTTIVTSGSSGSILYDNAGVLANKTIANFLAAGSGVTISGTTTATIGADLANGSQFLSGTASKVVASDVIYQAETTTTFNATQALDFNTFYNTKITLTANITSFSCSNQKAGQSGSIRFIQDATGSRTLPGTFGCNMKFPGGTQPVLTTTANAIDVLVYACSASNYCVGNLMKNVQ